LPCRTGRFCGPRGRLARDTGKDKDKDTAHLKAESWVAGWAELSGVQLAPLVSQSAKRWAEA